MGGNRVAETSQQPRVMKFGGTSVGSAASLAQVLNIIAHESCNGPLAVVVSAMGQTTDHLIEAVSCAASGDTVRAGTVVDGIEESVLSCVTGACAALAAQEALHGAHPDFEAHVRQVLAPLKQLLGGVGIVRERTAQTLDLVMSFGERLSASSLALLLQAMNLSTVYVDSREWTVTDDNFGLAKVDIEASRAKVRAMSESWKGRISVHTGFLGRTPDGRTTTLGRNGSDYTAALLAQALSAQEVVIWTDVSGIMTADPAIVDDTYTVPRLSHEEALELANLGWRMFHPRTMIPLIESGIPMRILNTGLPQDPGTLVDAQGSRDENRPTCVTSLENLALMEVEFNQMAEETSAGQRVLGALDRESVAVWMAVQTPRGRALAIAVPEGQRALAQRVIQKELAVEFERKLVSVPRVNEPVTLVTLVAEAMGRTVNVSGRFLHAIGRSGWAKRTPAASSLAASGSRSGVSKLNSQLPQPRRSGRGDPAPKTMSQTSSICQIERPAA